MKNYIRQNISAVYITDANGVAVEADALDWLGVSLLTGEPPAPPELILALDDIIMTVGDDPVETNLDDHFDGADSYTVSPAGQGVTITGALMTTTADAARVAEITVTAKNLGGDTPDTFNLTVEESVVEPELSIQNVDGEPVVSGSGDVSWTITAPQEYAGGPYTVDKSNEYSGNLNIDYTENTAPQVIVMPAIRRVGGQRDVVGATYRAIAPLWQVEQGDIVTSQGGLWVMGGGVTDVPADEAFTAVESGPVSAKYYMEVQGKQVRTVDSDSIEIAANTSTESIFIAPDGTNIVNYSDDKGRTFTSTGSGGTLGLVIYSNRSRRTWSNSSGYIVRASDTVPPDQYAALVFKAPAVLTASSQWKDTDIGPAVRMGATNINTTTNPELFNCYTVAISTAATGIRATLYRVDSYGNTPTNRATLAQSAILPFAQVQGRTFTLGLYAAGSTLTATIDDDVLITHVDAKFTTGGCGIWARASDVAEERGREDGVISFDCGSL